jgi:hypothetical protein
MMQTKTPIIIAHRGNAYGPSEKENSRDQINRTIFHHFFAEIDLWVLNEQSLWIGHNKPEYQMTKSEFEALKPYLYVHCKNAAALQFCIQYQFIGFSHDQDPFVLTTQQEIWVHPTQIDSWEHNSTMTKTIFCLPECMKTESLFSRSYVTPTTVCTDYPFLWQFLNNLNIEDDDNVQDNEYKLKLWKQGIYLDSIYDEIENRKDVIFKAQNPNLLESDRCIAVFSDIHGSSPLESICNLMRDKFPQFMTFHSLKNKQPKDGCLHFTHMQLSTFDYCYKNGILQENLDIAEQKLKKIDYDIKQNHIPDQELMEQKSICDKYLLENFGTKYESDSDSENEIHLDDSNQKNIMYHRVLLVPAGIILVGYPSWTLLDWRKEVRRELSDCKFFCEPHAQNIAHSTLLRFTREPTVEEIQNIKLIMKHIQTKLPIFAAVTPKMLASCNWKMGKEIYR